MFAKKPLLLILAAIFVIGGCSSQDDPTHPENLRQQASAVIRGEISNDLLDFEIVAPILGQSARLGPGSRFPQRSGDRAGAHRHDWPRNGL